MLERLEELLDLEHAALDTAVSPGIGESGPYYHIGTYNPRFYSLSAGLVRGGLGEGEARAQDLSHLIGIFKGKISRIEGFQLLYRDR